MSNTAFRSKIISTVDRALRKFTIGKSSNDRVSGSEKLTLKFPAYVYTSIVTTIYRFILIIYFLERSSDC